MMKARADQPKEHFARLLDVADDRIDYGEIPATAAVDWKNAEVLLPVSAEKFRAIGQFIRARRQERGPDAVPRPS